MSLTAVTFTTQDYFKKESEKVRARFEDSHNGKAAVRERSDLVDKVATQLWNSATGSAERLENLCVVALGGYGRQTLFPCSDVDLLFLSASSPEEQAQKRIRKLCQDLWDVHLRVSPTTRTLADCSKLHRDNLEFNISLLDCRYLCGNAGIFEQLRKQIIPKMVAQDATELMHRLADLTRARHRKYGGTLFHLEPNIKDCPGGLRDVHVCRWISKIQNGGLESSGKASVTKGSETIEGSDREEFHQAVEFLFRVRCFLHYRHERDDNTLDWQAQDAAAAAAVG